MKVARAPRQLKVPSGLATLISRLHPQIKRKLRHALGAILAEPNCGKALKADLVGLRSLRVGRFRVIYRIGSARRVDLVAFGPRERIYEETHRLILRQEEKE